MALGTWPSSERLADRWSPRGMHTFTSPLAGPARRSTPRRAGDLAGFHRPRPDRSLPRTRRAAPGDRRSTARLTPSSSLPSRARSSGAIASCSPRATDEANGSTTVPVITARARSSGPASATSSPTPRPVWRMNGTVVTISFGATGQPPLDGGGFPAQGSERADADRRGALAVHLHGEDLDRGHRPHLVRPEQRRPIGLCLGGVGVGVHGDVHELADPQRIVEEPIHEATTARRPAMPTTPTTTVGMQRGAGPAGGRRGEQSRRGAQAQADVGRRSSPPTRRPVRGVGGGRCGRARRREGRLLRAPRPPTSQATARTAGSMSTVHRRRPTRSARPLGTRSSMAGHDADGADGADEHDGRARGAGPPDGGSARSPGRSPGGR